MRQVRIRKDKVDMRRAAAFYVLGCLPCEEIPEIAAFALEEGFDTPTLRILAGEFNPIMSEVGPLFEKSLKELGIEFPNQKGAAWIIIEYYLKLVTVGSVEPIEGLSALISDLYNSNYNFHSATKEYVGDSHGIEHLVGAYWYYDDMMENPKKISLKELDELRKTIIELAKEWLSRYGQQ